MTKAAQNDLRPVRYAARGAGGVKTGVETEGGSVVVPDALLLYPAVRSPHKRNAPEETPGA